ncbi:hypothetical protein PVAG01_04830 [Phlyctema vagabunda]|uniref:Uncharacterized protein n=1 Tax=Phlyctema vagabunda TaxID=108571 RepID=A0ABR4PIL8_9HELO
MSGIEAAGLVLGAIPLVLAAIDQYNKGLSAFEAFKKWKDISHKAVTELWHEYTRLVSTIETLLEGIATEAMLEEMKVDPLSQFWKSAEIAEEVRAKLGTTYSSFEFTIREMEQNMLVLSSHLNIEESNHPTELEAIVKANPPKPKDGQHKQHGMPGLPDFELDKRIKFTMKRHEVKQRMKDLQNCNERLYEYLKRADKVDHSPFYRDYQRVRYSVPLHETQNYAQRLHAALVKAWSHSSHSTDSTHCANLLLEHRLASRREYRRQNLALFRLSLLVPQSSKWRDAEIRMMSRENQR